MVPGLALVSPLVEQGLRRRARQKGSSEVCFALLACWKGWLEAPWAYMQEVTTAWWPQAPLFHGTLSRKHICKNWFPATDTVKAKACECYLAWWCKSELLDSLVSSPPFHLISASSCFAPTSEVCSWTPDDTTLLSILAVWDLEIQKEIHGVWFSISQQHPWGFEEELHQNISLLYSFVSEGIESRAEGLSLGRLARRRSSAWQDWGCWYKDSLCEPCAKGELWGDLDQCRME